MSDRITVKIETFEFETRSASEDYVKCGLEIKFEKADREFAILFDNGSLREILSEMEKYFSGKITRNTDTVYYIPWIAGNYVVYPISFKIDVENKRWIFQYKESQNDLDFDFVREMSEDDVRSMYDQINKQYSSIAWDSLGKAELYTFELPEREFEWCYSARAFGAAFGDIVRNKMIRALYVSATNYQSPLRIRENFVNYYVGSEVVIEFDDALVDLLIHAQGLYQWRFFDKNEVCILGPRLGFVENGDEEFCRIANVYNAFDLEYLNSKIKSVSVEATNYWPWSARGFDKSKLGEPIELPENLHIELENGNRLSFLGWDDDFVIKIEAEKFLSDEADEIDDFKKGTVVMDYLSSIGLDMLTIGDAICDENLEKSYEIITRNPAINKYEFVELLGIDYDEEEILMYRFLCRLQMPPYYMEEAMNEDNYEKTLEIMKKQPQISREAFLKLMQFTDKYKKLFECD